MEPIRNDYCMLNTAQRRRSKRGTEKGIYFIVFISLFENPLRRGVRNRVHFSSETKASTVMRCATGTTGGTS